MYIFTSEFVSFKRIQDSTVSTGWEGPQVNKVEQVSSDDHHMSVAGEGVDAQV